jgi:hypothetical protein
MLISVSEVRNMKGESITCPNCGEDIPLDEVVIHSVKERVEKELKKSEKRIREKAAAKAKKAFNLELKDMKNQLKEREEKIKKAEDAELELRKKGRELEEKMSKMDLELERKLAERTSKIEDMIAKKYVEEKKLSDRENEEKIRGLTGKIEELKRKVEQGSQQLQGEVLELELEDSLREFFPEDTIEPVPKGKRGADVVQKVHRAGKCCGSIIWEAKRTKNWGKTWIPKLKKDQARVKADVAVIVSTTLPEDVDTFSMIDGVFVTSYNTALPLAATLRGNIHNVFKTKQINVDRSDKKEQLYDYISGTEFSQNVEAIVRALVVMKDDLNKERTAISKSWAKRDKQMVQIVLNLGNVYGGLQGILDTSLPEIEMLELPPGSDE